MNISRDLTELRARWKSDLNAATRWLDRRFYPQYQSENDVFNHVVERCLTPDTVALDAGCGIGSYHYDFKDKVHELVGCDVVEGVRSNPNLDRGVVGDLAKMPFPDASFDVVFSRYVIEHLEQPSDVFREFARVMSPGGHLILLTPSRFHYVQLISSITPYWFHVAMTSARGTPREDIFPTTYAANTAPVLTRLCVSSGLTVESLHQLEARPNYLVISPFTFGLGILYERTVSRFNLLAPLRSSIVMTACKK